MAWLTAYSWQSHTLLPVLHTGHNHPLCVCVCEWMFLRDLVVCHCAAVPTPAGWGGGVPPMKCTGVSLHNTLQHVSHVSIAAPTHFCAHIPSLLTGCFYLKCFRQEVRVNFSSLYLPAFSLKTSPTTGLMNWRDATDSSSVVFVDTLFGKWRASVHVKSTRYNMCCPLVCYMQIMAKLLSGEMSILDDKGHLALTKLPPWSSPHCF